MDPTHCEPLSKLGFDCLTDLPSLATFTALLEKYRARASSLKIKALLLDQVGVQGLRIKALLLDQVGVQGLRIKALLLD